MKTSIFRKLNENSFLLELSHNHHLVLVLDENGTIIWTQNPPQQNNFSDASDFLINKSIHDFYTLPEKELNRLKTADLAWLENIYSGDSDPNGHDPALASLPAYPSKNVYESRFMKLNFHASLQFTSLRLLKIEERSFLGIIYTRSRLLQLNTWNTDISLLVENKNRLIGYNDHFLDELGEKPVRLGAPLSDYITTEFQDFPMTEEPPAEKGKCLFQFPGQAQAALEFNLPALFEAGASAIRCRPAEINTPAFLKIPIETDLEKQDYSLELEWEELTGPPPLCIFNACGLDGAQFPDEAGLLFGPSGAKELFFFLKKEGEVSSHFNYTAFPRTAASNYRIVKTRGQWMFFYNNQAIGNYRAVPLKNEPGHHFVVIGLRSGSACTITGIRLTQYPLLKPVTASTGNTTSFTGKPDRLFIAHTRYLAAEGEDGSDIRHLRLEDLSAREKIRRLQDIKKENEAEILRLKQSLYPETGLERIVGKSPIMLKIKESLKTIAESNASLFITGETGTGKSILAEAVHELSHRSTGPMIKVDCSTLPETLIESELFGFEKGAFTGANNLYKGKFEQATGGTLFLDEIGNINLNVQAKLLNVLQDKTLYRLGGKEAHPLDVRILTATNLDPEKMVGSGQFRKDLYYRLNVITLNMPSLRDRPEDIPLLCEHFLNTEFRKYSFSADSISPAVYEYFMRYSWPGNVRELQNVLLKSMVFCKRKTLHVEDILMPEFQGMSAPVSIGAGKQKKYYKRIAVERIKSEIKACEGNISMAADKLNITRRTIYLKLAKAGVDMASLR